MGRRPDPFKAFMRECYAEALAAGEVPAGRGGKPMGFVAWMRNVHSILITDNHGWDDRRRRLVLPMSACSPALGNQRRHEPRFATIVPEVTKPTEPRQGNYRGWIVPEHDTRERAA